MPVDRTPPASEAANASKAVFIAPSGKLAAVTRKGNELTELINNHEKDVDNLARNFKQYLEKIELLEEACHIQSDLDEVEEQKMNSWLSPHKSDFVNLQITYQKYLEELHGVKPKKLPSNRSYISRASSRASNSSSARIKLAEMKAKLAADKIYNVKINQLKLEEFEQSKRKEAEDFEKRKRKEVEDFEERKRTEAEELEREMKMKVIEEERLEMEHNVLESELSKLDDIANNLERSPSVAPEETYQLQTPLQLPPPQIASTTLPKLLDSKIVRVIEKQNEISLKIAKHQEKAELPKKEITIFSGDDITEYRAFIQNFNRTVLKKCENPADSFYYLEQYTSGMARELVKSCNHNDEAVAYEQAISLLEEEYGNEHRTATAYLQRLENWPTIKSEDGEALRKLSIYLLTCSNNMGSMNTINQLNSPKEIMNVVMKLPYELRKSWRNRTMELTENKKCVEFRHLVEFVRKHSKLTNQPLFGKIKDSGRENNIKPALDDKNRFLGVRAMATKVVATGDSQPLPQSPAERYCYYCRKNNHNIDYCYFFKEMSYDEKMKYFDKNRLCYGCAKPGHFSKGCSQRQTCKLCQRKHPTILHNDNFVLRTPAVNQAQQDCGEDE